MKAGKGQVPVLAGRAQGACTWQFAAVISSCIAELVAPIQGESILECEKKKKFKTQVVADFGAWHGHFCRVRIFLVLL